MIILCGLSFGAVVGVWIFVFELQKRIERLEAELRDKIMELDNGVEEVQDVKENGRTRSH